LFDYKINQLNIN